MAMTLQLLGGGSTVTLSGTSGSTTWDPLDDGADFAMPSLSTIKGPDSLAMPGVPHVGSKWGNRLITMHLLCRDSSADGIITAIRSIETILQRARVEQAGRSGYPQSFVNELDCYLSYVPDGASAGVYYRVLGGRVACGNITWHVYWQSFQALVTLEIECWPHALATTYTQGTKAATAWSSMPLTIASGDAGGNDGVDVAPIRLAVRNPATTQYSKVYGAIYPNVGTPLRSNDGTGTGCLVDTAGAGSEAGCYGPANSYYRTNIDSTSYEQVGSLAITTDGRPRRYLVIVKRRTSVVTNLNWRIATSGGVVVSPVWTDDSTPNNSWGGLVAGQITYPHMEFTGTTDASGNPNTFNVTLQLQAAKQASGDPTADVDTDFIVFIPMDLGVYFLAQPTAAVWVSTDHDNLHVYNDDGIARIVCAKGAGGKGGPGELVDSVSPNPVSFSGRLPTLYPGANQVVVVAIRSDGTIIHTDQVSLVWTIRKRYLAL